MNKHYLLDCTLREHYSYVFSLQPQEACDIYSLISESGIDYIECGHLRRASLCEAPLMQEDISKYDEIFPKTQTKCLVLMDINRFDIDKLSDYSGGVVSGIRLCFKQSELSIVPRIAEQIKAKGYDLFIQHVDFIGYEKTKIVQFLHLMNSINPTGYCIVDTFGAMFPQDLDYAIDLIYNNLNSNIMVGFHGHNNQMMANALNIKLLESPLSIRRNVVVDSTMLGLGRGSGNANTEIMCKYFRPERIESVIKCADYIIAQNRLDSHLLKLAYFITGIFDAHTFIADKLIDQVGTLYEFYELLRKSESSVLKSYDENTIASILDGRGR